jgi:hypothetical protein
MIELPASMGDAMDCRITQIGCLMIVVACVIIFLIIGKILSPGSDPALIFVQVILVAGLLIFTSLTIGIRGEFQAWRFAVALIRKNVLHSDIIPTAYLKRLECLAGNFCV